MHKLLVANRGEIAVRVMRAAAALEIPTVAVHPADDARSLHVRAADVARELPGSGPAAYLDATALVDVAEELGCDAVHPGYGFLSENAEFARLCRDRGLVFVGPPPEVLELYGDKLRARQLAHRCGIPTLPGTDAFDSSDQARQFLESLGPGGAMILKAVAGGGGRGMRVVRSPDEVEEALARCRSEALGAFGNGSVYGERLVERAQHIEVQIVADRYGTILHLGERDCSIQRRHQKVIEIAPSPTLADDVRERIIDGAVAMAANTGYESLGTYEFLVDASGSDHPQPVYFIETNPRLQVEHTVTEMVTGIDLVQLQLRLAGGMSLAELGLDQASVGPPRGFAIQARVNLETMEADGSVRPTGGELAAFEAPTGPGIRTDTFGYTGYRTSTRYDSLLAKVIAYDPSSDFRACARRLVRALTEFRVEGAATNIAFLQAVLEHPRFVAGDVYTSFIDDHLDELVGRGEPPRRFFESASEQPPSGRSTVRTAGASVDRNDPLAVLAYSRSAAPGTGRAAGGLVEAAPAGTVAVETAVQGTIVRVDVAVGELVRKGHPLLVMEAMKMEHVVAAPVAGVVREVTVTAGDTVYDGSPVVFIEQAEFEGSDVDESEELDLDAIRPDLALVLERQRYTRDEARPQAVEARHAQGLRTARENIEDLCDPGTFVEYGALGLPTHLNRPMDELIRRYPADGMVTGVGGVNGQLFGDPASRCAVLSYDYTVLAGTQGAINHRKTDRLLEVAYDLRLPVVLFTEGGGGRAGQRSEGPRNSVGEPILTQVGGPADVPTWRRLGMLSGLVPLVGVNSGYCFAGNAALLGCCDVIVATANSSIGMGGPALIEGGNLGVFRPEEIGPMDVQTRNGVVDIAVADEVEAVDAARRYLSYFQGRVSTWEAADQRPLRHAVPENRLRVYDVRRIIELLADVGTMLELRPSFGLGMVTALIRIEGRPVGVIANNPTHLAGAVDSDAADKAARFLKVCDTFDIPILSLCDTPGIMVGPEAEKTALVRHAARMFVTGANLSVPLVAVVLRKAYGLGVMTMVGASFKATTMTLSWPTGEFGGMGLEGQVKLGQREHLAAITDPAERLRRYEELVEAAYAHGRAINHGVSFGVDDVIDPADTRAIVANLLASARPPEPRVGKKRPSIDAW